MSNRSFEMYEYRQVIYRMRLGESDRAIAKGGLMGRRKAAELRKCEKEHVGCGTLLNLLNCDYLGMEFLTCDMASYIKGWTHRTWLRDQ